MVKDVDPLLSRTGVVYRVPCSCEKECIGETKRALGTATINIRQIPEEGK